MKKLNAGELNGLFQKSNLDELFQESNLDELFPSTTESDMQQCLNGEIEKDIARSAGNIKVISLQEVADLLTGNYSVTLNHAGMVTNTFDHPTTGRATTIQANGCEGALLIEHL